LNAELKRMKKRAEVIFERVETEKLTEKEDES
jgi:hypothetical protein